MSKEEEYQEQLREDPGDPVFAEYADYLRSHGYYREAYEVCFNGLSLNPSCHKGRLVLARVFYEKQQLPFAIRELEQLCEELPENQALKKLLDQLAPDQIATDAEAGAGSEEMVAETDFDFEELDLIEEDDEVN